MNRESEGSIGNINLYISMELQLHIVYIMHSQYDVAPNHGILKLRQCMQHFEFWLRVRCLAARFFDVVQIKIIVSMIR